MKKITVVAGTRPEIIKLAPLIHSLKEFSRLQFITTGQHEEMAKQALEIFSLSPDEELKLMQSSQTPVEFLSAALPKLETAIRDYQPEIVIAQGDTATTFASALASFHSNIPFAHIEAGLRTGELQSPFPEEGYRAMISRISQYHFCPTQSALENLHNEGIKENVFLCGNTVVDALFLIRQKLKNGELSPSLSLKTLLSSDKPLILVTGHRRENHHQPLKILCQSVARIATEYPNTEIVFPVHLNPLVSDVVYSTLNDINNVTLIDPIDYVSTIALLLKAELVISDSGGIQEEAPYCDTYILVTRNHTEREEVITQGFGQLVPLSSVDSVVEAAKSILNNPKPKHSGAPFGDGTAARRITEILCA